MEFRSIPCPHILSIELNKVLLNFNFLQRKFGYFNLMHYLCVIETERGRRAALQNENNPNTTSKHFGKLIKL